METVTMDAIITAITALVTGMVGWMGQMVTFITANPLVLAFTLVSFVGLGIGGLMRLIRG